MTTHQTPTADLIAESRALRAAAKATLASLRQSAALDRGLMAQRHKNSEELLRQSYRTLARLRWLLQD